MRGVLVSVLTLLALSGAAFGEGNPLLDPAGVSETAPATYKAKFETSKGDFVIEVTREWSPAGADRFYTLVKHGFYDETRFFRVLKGFVVQWGMHGDPDVTAAWRAVPIKDEPVVQGNEKGYITYAKGGPNSRTTQVFINLEANSRLDGMGFSAFGKVSEGMEVVKALYGGYGEGAPRGRGPGQGQISAKGNDYLINNFPKLDYIKKATIIE
ncbi:peptidylprolyl isomerase [Acidobacteria bacterium Mor1]|nr:peptidylprolyl isomerase [Acidobacteria bacterium Mor1]